MHSSGTGPVTFFGHNPRLGEHISCLEGHISCFGGEARPLNAPRGAGPVFLPPQNACFGE